MNPRVKELIEQANIGLDGVRPGSQPMIDPSYNQFIEKFAELIVRECAEVGFDSVNAGHSIDYLKNHVCYNILNYFGVER